MTCRTRHPTAAFGDPRRRRKTHLYRQLAALQARLEEAEQTLEAIAGDEVDALIVRTRARGTEELLTLDRAYLPYQHLVEMMREGALTVAEDGTVLHCNRRFAEMVELPAERIVGSPLFTLLDRREADALRDLLSRASGCAQRAEFTLRTERGSLPVEMSISLLPMSEARRAGIVVSHVAGARDEANREALRERVTDLGGKYSRLETVLAQVPAGILLADVPTGRITYVNRRAREILGREPVAASISLNEIMYWRPDGRIVEPEELPLARLLATGRPVPEDEIACVRGDGSIVFTRVSGALVEGHDGTIPIAVVAFEDITAERTARAEREAEERVRELFIGMLAHDLRSPLNIIVMGAQTLGRRADGETGKHLERIGRSGERMSRMIEQLLDFTRSRTGGGIPVTRAPTDLFELVQHAVADLATTRPDRLIQVDHVGRPAVGEWDADRLTQVVFNLVCNALVHGAKDEPVRITVHGHDGFTTLDVHNEGAIPPELIPVLFDPFRRGRLAEAGASDGLGLGLYITQEIVRAHDGTIAVDSATDRGTTFSVVLPARAQQNFQRPTA